MALFLMKISYRALIARKLISGLSLMAPYSSFR